MTSHGKRRAKLFAACTVLWALVHARVATAGVGVIDPDAFPAGTDISLKYPGVTLSLSDGPGNSGQPPAGTAIFAFETTIASTGSNTFAFATRDGLYRPLFVQGLEDLKIEFDDPTSFISVDFITDDTADPGRLAVFDASGNLLDTIETLGAVGFGGVETASLSRAQNDIAFAIAGGHGSQAVYIDNVQYSVVPEPATITLLGIAMFLLATIVCRKRYQ
jgi:hypothetical protein